MAKRGLIIGAGPGGLAAAVALRRHGVEAVVYEQSEAQWDAGAGLTLWPNAFRALDALGVGDAVRAASRPLDGMAMYSWRGTSLFTIPDAEMQARFGGSGCTLTRRTLVDVLRQALGDTPLHVGRRCTGFAADGAGVTAHFDDGTEARGAFLVGADGLRSTVRTQLLGLRDRQTDLRYAGFTVWRGLADFDLQPATGTTYLGRGRQFGTFALRGRQVYWFASANAPEGEQDDPADHCRALRDGFAGWPPAVQRVLDATDAAVLLRNDVYDRDPLDRWSYGPVTLLGDAAHPFAPTLGQGACQALEDAAVLARRLHAHADVATALRAYEAQRVPRARTVTLQSRQMGCTGQWEHPLACWLRDGLIRLTPRSLNLKQLDALFRFEA